jgi:hypothetical protein
VIEDKRREKVEGNGRGIKKDAKGEGKTKG